MVPVMKLFQSLVRQFEETRSRQSVQRLSQYVVTVRQAIQVMGHATQENRQPCVKSTSTKLASSDHQVIKRTVRSPLLLGITVVSLTSALGYRFYNTPKLDIGKQATQTIFAPANATIEDLKATDESRKAARTGSVPVLQINRTATQQIQRQLQQQLQQGNIVRHLAGNFPYAKTSALSIPVQAALRKIPEAEWQSILSSVDRRFPQSPLAVGVDANTPSPTTAPEHQKAIAELRAYRRSTDLGAYMLLVQEVTEARMRYSAAITSVTPPISTELPASFDLAVLDLTDVDWKKIQTNLPSIAERMLIQGIPPGLPGSILQEATNRHVEREIPASAQAIANQLLLAFLQPNLIRDEEQTRLLAEQAAQQIKPVMVNIRRGEPIVRQGEVITSEDFALLEHFKLSRREIDWVGLIGFAALVSGAVATVWMVKRRYYPNLRRRDGLLLWLLSLSAPLLIALHFPSTNLPAVGLLISSFYGAPLGMTVPGLLTVLLAVGMDMNVSYLLSSAAGGLLCGWLGGRLRSREELAVLGIGVGLLQGGLYLVLNVASGTVWYTLLGASVIQAVIGLAWVIGGMGSSAYLEQLFDLVTTIRLVELANPNRPLLKRLAAHAPGTFQHTLFVATLAEAAAHALGCNVELVRTGTLYHDIGKMHDPLGFIENQMGGPNKHDIINDPWESAEIIKKHVSEGLVMARKARLPKAVQAFIPEHQGTMLIAYFYHQAQQAKNLDKPGSRTVNEADFRYDGPIPQSRETGIVMLADSCEAALRSLKDATPEEALTMINKILRARWQDNQLINSGITREEMSQIAEIFVQVWQQFNHQRIPYPKLTPLSPQSLVTG
ncbi:putative domain HDIG-containing protein [Leptolyngbyaceae cyanobacterium JSC-12]|nr:putative domain HDIG-containing protein [Leptolyngbyaceae cyanobacterium JSC-12]